MNYKIIYCLLKCRLFLEKIRNHPEFSTVPANVKQDNKKQLREVMPKAESLKKSLLEQYKAEYDEYKIYLVYVFIAK